MIKRQPLTPGQARYCMEHGEFEDDVRKAAEHTAVILSQDWCPQWRTMDRYLSKEEERGGRSEDTVVFEFIYNKVDFFDRFRRFKEEHFGNFLIPYVRFYHNGELGAVANYIDKDDFFSFLFFPKKEDA